MDCCRSSRGSRTVTGAVPGTVPGTAPLAATALLIVFAAGCSAAFPFARNEFGPALPKDATVEVVVARVNANIARLQSWKSDDVSISGPALPVHLAGQIAVARPRNFRLTASAMGMDEADFGSNGDRFWFWVKRAQPHGQPNYVYQARHEDVEHSDLLRQVPFQPDWLMEALGVVPIDPHQVTLHPDSTGQVVNLISEQLSPAGQVVKKVIRVDTRRGVILGQSLHDASGKLIAKAQLGNHQVDKSGQIMPHLIVLEWPQAQMKINLEIGHIDTNPSSIPKRIWDVPKKPYYPPYDIGAQARNRVEHAKATSRGSAHPDGDQQTGQSSPFAEAASADVSAGEVPRGRGNAGITIPRAERDAEWSKPIESTGIHGGSAVPNSVPTEPDPSAAMMPRDRTVKPLASTGGDPFSFDDDPAPAQAPRRSTTSSNEAIETSPH